ncbi:arylesterase [Roseateles oligotrophus]|uniref:Arylesterase n=1 Tax=Roseateles oligotrophus TaxID=1769250 RepID=A0ABT2YJC5_9BURK|nr:arylesterase [Roseateles oligotrophus]MCV2370175.1 arylesterase [Roseateles oligotrophus]
MTSRRRDCCAYFSALALAWAAPGLAGAAPAAQSKTAPLVLVVGDSLSAEYGLARGQGWVALLEQRLKEKKLPLQVLNASISGDTTAGGRARFGALLQQHKPSVVIIELGGNDALRGLPLASSHENLLAMTRAAKAAGARVLLLGMQVPPNYGASYGREFAGIFERIAKEEKVALTPFLLKGVADRPDAMDWFQPDRIHPLAKAHPVMLDLVWPSLQPLL